MKNYVTEFIGTFFLVFTIGLSVGGGTTLPPLAIGAALMVMVYMGGHISGAHYNPAVTVAVFFRGKLPAAQVLPYWIAQVGGSFAAAALLTTVFGKPLLVAPSSGATSMQSLLIEVLFTFALALVVLNVATSAKTANNSYYGLAIGFTVMAAAFAGGGISGGAFNPAVGLGPALMDLTQGGSSISAAWLYVVGPLLGGVLAAIVFKMQDEE